MKESETGQSLELGDVIACSRQNLIKQFDKMIERY